MDKSLDGIVTKIKLLEKVWYSYMDNPVGDYISFEKSIERLSSDPLLYNAYHSIFLGETNDKEDAAKRFIKKEFSEVSEALEDMRNKKQDTWYCLIPYYTLMEKTLRHVAFGEDLPKEYEKYDAISNFIKRFEKAYYSRS